MLALIVINCSQYSCSSAVLDRPQFQVDKLRTADKRNSQMGCVCYVAREELLDRCCSTGVFHGSSHVRSCLWKDRLESALKGLKVFS